VERGRVQGRAQEWNISRTELDALVSTGVLTQSEYRYNRPLDCNESRGC